MSLDNHVRCLAIAKKKYLELAKMKLDDSYLKAKAG